MKIINNINSELLVFPKASIKDAMENLEKVSEKVLLVTNSDKELLGTITDGDIRRYILSGKNINENISKAYNSNPKFIKESNLNKVEIKKLFSQYKINLIPIVGDNKIISGYIVWQEFVDKKALHKIHNKIINSSLVIMAGGKGERMLPFTKVLPKPLLPAGNKAMVERIIDSFTQYGVTDIHMTINYMGDTIKAFFSDKKRLNIKFINENNPLGTAGGLKKISIKLKNPFFVSNCDTLIKTDLYEFYQFHIKNDYDISLIASLKNYQVPYGVCNVGKNGILLDLVEKPEQSYLISTGLYIINPNVLDLLENDKYSDMTELMNSLKNDGGKIGVYPVSESSWIDVGQWKEYKQLKDLFDE